MSAFLCSQEHLSALVNYACAHARAGCHFELLKSDDARHKTDADHTFAVLLAENLKSLEARYPGEGKITDWYDGAVPLYCFRFDLHRVWKPVQIIKAAHCYAYQSCEHDGWDTSEAKHWIDALVDHAIGHLPGYEEAAWRIA